MDAEKLLCAGERDYRGVPICGGPDVVPVAVVFERVPFKTEWCQRHREIAMGNGARVTLSR